MPSRSTFRPCSHQIFHFHFQFLSGKAALGYDNENSKLLWALVVSLLKLKWNGFMLSHCISYYLHCTQDLYLTPQAGFTCQRTAAIKKRPIAMGSPVNPILNAMEAILKVSSAAFLPGTWDHCSYLQDLQPWLLGSTGLVRRMVSSGEAL